MEQGGKKEKKTPLSNQREEGEKNGKSFYLKKGGSKNVKKEKRNTLTGKEKKVHLERIRIGKNEGG